MNYVFQAYPMRITAPDGKRIRVFSQDEHDRLLEQWTEPEAVRPSPGAEKADNPLLSTPASNPDDVEPEA